MKNKLYTKVIANGSIRWLLITGIMLFSIGVNAQLTGIKNIPGDYADLAAAVTDLNTQGVGAGGVTLNVLAAQTAPVGGYVIGGAGSLVLTSSSAANPITIEGNNNVISAADLSSGTAGAINDAVFKLIGADFVTITHCTITEHPANITGVTLQGSNRRTEWGIALLYVTVTDGAQNNSIIDNDISLTRYQVAFGIYSNNRHAESAVGTIADASAASGSNSFNKIYSNDIHTVTFPIVFIGSQSVTANNAMDNGNDIGGSSAATGNNITNWGSTGTALVTNSIAGMTGNWPGILMFNQYNNNISYNTLISASVTISGTGALDAVRCDYPGTTTAQPTGTHTTTISHNTFKLSNTPLAGSTSAVNGVIHASLAASPTATITISNNLMEDFKLLGTNLSTNTVRGVSVSSAPFDLNISNNTFRGWVQNSPSGQCQGLVNTGATGKNINFTNNKLGDATAGWITYTANSTGTLFGVLNVNGNDAATLNITGNDIRGIVHSAGAGAQVYFTNQTSGTLFHGGSTNISFNTLTNLTTGATGTASIQMFRNSGSGTNPAAQQHAAGTNHTVSNNSIVGGYTVTGTPGSIFLYIAAALSGPTVSETNSNNNFSNITFAGATPFFGWLNVDGGALGNKKIVSNNIFSNITSPGSGAITVLEVEASDSTGASNDVSNNTITNISSGTGSITGILSVDQSQNFIGNTISGFNTGGATVIGIDIEASSATQNIKKNKICDLQSTNAAAAVDGIRVNGTSFTISEISNNIIGDLKAPAANSANAVNGINLQLAASVNVFYNTVYLSGTSSAGLFGSSDISIASGVTTYALNNNIFVNASTPKGAGLAVAHRGSSAALSNYGATSDNNDFFAPTVYDDGTNTFGSLSSYQSFLTPGRDDFSVSVNPPFLSTTCSAANFLHVNPAVQTAVESGGAPVSVTDDFDGDARNVTTPDMGADEFNGIPQPICSGTPASGSITGASAVCFGTGTTLSLSGHSTDLNVTYQWKSSSTPGGPYTTILGTGVLQATGPLTAPTYYIVEVTCTQGVITNTSTTAEFAVGINPLPSVSVSPSSGLICLPGGSPVALTASGASSYTWSPTSGLTPTAGASVSANPIANTTYIVTGTDANNCENTASVTVTVSNTPTSVSASATPPTVCSGDFSILDVSSVNTIPSYASTYQFSASNGTFTPLTGATTVGTLTDDDAAAIVPFGFNFVYEGNSYSIAAMNTNGFLSLLNTGGGQTNNLSTGAIRPVIAALWDDISGLDGGGNPLGTGSYQTSGLPGSQVFTAEWLNWTWDFAGASPSISFQIKLYEADGKIEYIYRQEAGAVSNGSGGASIGLSSVLSGNFLSLNNSSASPVASSTSEVNTISIRPATGQVYTFLPPAQTVTYSWDPAAGLKPTSTVQSPETPALPTGTTVYTVTVSNNGCTATATTSVTSGEALVCSPATASSATVCTGTTFTVTANHTGGGAPFSYSWSDGAGGIYPNSQSISANLPAGVYSFEATVTDGCGNTCISSVTITVNQAPTASTTPNGSVPACSNSLPLVLTAGTDIGTSYQWNNNGTAIGGATNPTLNVSTSGNYSVTVSANGCPVESAPVTVTVTTQDSPPVSGITPNDITVCLNATTSPNFSGNCNETTTITSTGTTPAFVDWTVGQGGFLNTVVLTLPVSGFPAGSQIIDVSLSVGIAHTWGGDINLGLAAPTGPFQKVLFDPLDQEKIFGTNGAPPTLQYTFNSTGTTIPASGVIPSPGPYTPFDPFSFFNGMDPNGTWAISVQDVIQFDGGRVDNISLTITAVSPTGTVEWYNVPSGGTSLASTTSFNPMTQGGATTNAPGVYDFYAECNQSGCPSARTHVTFTVDNTPCVTNVTLNSCVLVEGFYFGGGTQAARLFTCGGSADPLASDNISVTAVECTGSGFVDVNTQIAVMKTDGSFTCTFGSGVTVGQPYWLRITHCGTTETWSNGPVVMSASTSYSFCTSAASAFASNLKDLDGTFFGMWSGDVNLDGAIDGSDFLVMDPLIQNGAGCDDCNDLNGDGAVDGSDFLILDPNIQNGIGAAIPSCP